MINVKHETTDDAMSCNTSVTSILKYLDDKSLEMDQLRNLESRPKKRRLDHLTWEEKIQRKKLKNRVAAQTSRDRKKAKMEQMEQAVQQLFANNETLLAQCESLKLANQRLVKENAELHERLRAPCASCAAAQSRPVGCEALNGPTESLLRPKGRATYPAAALSSALLKVIASCLLYQTCSTSSTPTSTLARWNSSLRASCRTSPGIWRMLLKRQIEKNQKSMEIDLQKWWGRHQQNWNPVDLIKS